MSSKNLFSIFLIAVVIGISSCQLDEKDTISHENQKSHFLDANDIVHFLSDSISLDGAVFSSQEEYDALPIMKLEDLPNLNNNTIEKRNSFLKLNTPPVWSQGKEGSCVAFSVGYVCISYYLRIIKNMAYSSNAAYRSPEFIYNNTKLKGSCENAGSNFETVLNFIKNFGVCSWSQMPYSDKNGCHILPTRTQWNQAKVGQIKSWGKITKSVENIKAYLKNGHPIIGGFTLDDNFYTQTFNKPFIYQTKGGSKRGRHAIAIVGYDDNKKVLIVQNSWGTSSHDKGFFYIAYHLIPQLDLVLYAIHPHI